MIFFTMIIHLYSLMLDIAKKLTNCWYDAILLGKGQVTQSTIMCSGPMTHIRTYTTVVAVLVT